MSDYLVNLARRSAGLAPVVRARVTPAVRVDLDSSAETAREQQVSRGGAGGAEVITRSVAPAPLTGNVANAATTIAPAPLARAASHVVSPVVQRAPIASASSAAPPAASAARAVDAPVVAPRTVPRAAVPAPIIVPAAKAVMSAANIAPDDAPRPRDTRDEPRTIETRTETVVRAEASDAAVPVVVTIEPAERAATPAPDTREEPMPERTVHVRIGAIEIIGADASSAQQHVVAAAASAPAVLPASPSGGFDEYAALRSYAPWAW